MNNKVSPHPVSSHSLKKIGDDKAFCKCPGCTGSVQGLWEVSQDVSGMRQLFPSLTVPSRECLGWGSEGGAAVRARPEINLRVGGRQESTGLTLYNLHDVHPRHPVQTQPPFPPGPAGGLGREDRVACLITHSANLEPKIRRQS